MTLHDKIQEAYKRNKSYPELVKALIEIGIQTYTVDVSTGTILYRLAQGEHFIHSGDGSSRKISEKFSKEQTIQAVKDTQQGKTTYPQFVDEIAKAGVRFYEATLTGNKRVTYIGPGGYYEEEIPF